MELFIFKAEKILCILHGHVFVMHLQVIWVVSKVQDLAYIAFANVI